MRNTLASLLRVATALALVLATLAATLTAAALFRADGVVFASHSFEHVAVVGDALSLLLLGTVLFRRASRPGPGRNPADVAAPTRVEGGFSMAHAVLLLGIALHAAIGGMLLFQVVGLYVHLPILSRNVGLLAGACLFTLILARYIATVRSWR